MRLRFERANYDVEPVIYFWDRSVNLFAFEFEYESSIERYRKYIIDALILRYPSISFHDKPQDIEDGCIHFSFKDESDHVSFLLWSNGGVDI